MSIEDITPGIDRVVVLAHSSKPTRDISSPAINTDYYLPESGDIDLEQYKEATFYIRATTNQPDVVQIEASLDDGANFYKLEGYEIAVAEFMLGTWNTIHVPLCAEHVRLLVSTNGSAPGSIEMACVMKA